MADAYSLAKQHLDTNIADAEAQNIDLNTYGQALIWKLLERYKDNGRSVKDIVDEVKYTLENIQDDDTFHVSRN
ncbi:MAG: hypothetical protein ACI9FB_003258 [Candidatus Azotimanducaceae bacterium]|jgi:hypothetical protein